MQYLDQFTKYAEERNTILCFGIDPIKEKVKGDIVSYFSSITDKLLEENLIAAIKPNYAFFAQYGFDGLNALKQITSRYKNNVPIILDGKRGDIGKTSDAYARELYELWNADATTVSPYMGSDSVLPFIRDDKITYMLCRTSNEGAKDFQELKIGKKFLYEKVAEKAVEWGCGLVVGATSDSIKRIVKITKNKIPMLIPGIGAQGGDLETVMTAIKSNPYIHRINASSSIAYAYEKKGGSAIDAAIKEAKELNKKMKEFF
ncbi:MAG: orotidine-5'-phosphate decarboxylase [Candidatus Micrarchaeota archaeon]|nr:orotidine-5'-phosphate decarboxylase [Candidatus Micrarchaeota archaeon]